MKKIIAMLLVLVMCLSICACNSESGTNTDNTNNDETNTDNTNNNETNTDNTNNNETNTSKIPTVEDVVNGIKYEFKDPDSVQMSDAHIASVKKGDVESDTEFYVIGTIRAKNSFGGYGDPQAYIIHCNNGKYKIVGEYNDASYMMQKTFNELGCGASWSID